jgi:hypothetical protein
MTSLMGSATFRQRGFCALALSLFATFVQAEVILGAGSSNNRSGSSVVSPPSSGAASSMRDKARTQRGGNETAVPLSTVIDALDDNDGPFGSRPAGPSTDTRNRARAYQQQGSDPAPVSSGGVTVVAPVEIERMMIDPESNRGKVKSNLDRARAYSQGDGLGVTNQRFGGKENLPIVDCGQIESTAGRIGDDVSGAVITVQRGNKAVKVRCK